MCVCVCVCVCVGVRCGVVWCGVMCVCFLCAVWCVCGVVCVWCGVMCVCVFYVWCGAVWCVCGVCVWCVCAGPDDHGGERVPGLGGGAGGGLGQPAHGQQAELRGRAGVAPLLPHRVHQVGTQNRSRRWRSKTLGNFRQVPGGTEAGLLRVEYIHGHSEYIMHVHMGVLGDVSLQTDRQLFDPHTKAMTICELIWMKQLYSLSRAVIQFGCALIVKKGNRWITLLSMLTFCKLPTAILVFLLRLGPPSPPKLGFSALQTETYMASGKYVSTLPLPLTPNRLPTRTSSLPGVFPCST